ncbi:MAG TPA: PAS domain S-box protein, partial [Nitrospira sp.]|nr:PAS domain S-box protein [Nitrospira sp.]
IARAVKVKHLSIEAASAKQALTASEDRFREVVQTAPDAIVIADGAGHVLSWNSAAERLFGYSASEILGQSMTLIMPERYRANHQRALERVRTTGDLRLKGTIVPMHGLHKDGREFPIEMSVSSWISGGQRVHCGIARDITARKEAEARLVQQQIEQQVLLDLIPAMVWYKDPHNRILRANRRAAESISKTVAEIEGHFTDEFYPDEAERYHLDDLEVIVSGRSKLGIVEPYRTGAGEKRWVQTDKVPYLDPQGNILGVLVFAQDITERRQIEAALRDSEERLRIVVESAQNGIVMVDANGRILLANAQFERQFGYEAKELLGRSADRLFSPPLPSRQTETQSDFPSSLMLDSPQLRHDTVGVRKDGVEFPLSIQLTSLMTTSGVCIVARVDDRQGPP